ncbi:hypothetical protein GZ77_07545 [Endozoicomonas montiporae]|uniref:Pilus assembly protein n=2 Tax=Endozoicomonas montiporae TaxID=1027273 RepID=A0A081N737_9GAMM|nr:Flp family type IVb pilin [Endozoicomonas montiporae]AMO55922.1 pilus assembly protein Flp/PilA [Endozoicomonas montiporae CL-33]KEQ14260.1 hypothetical protein GZ77_07545 [Endozoicomonas montiporae]
MLTKLYVKSAVALDQLRKDERGVTAIEYAIVAVAIAGVVAAVFTSDSSSGLKTALDAAFTNITNAITP